MMNNVVKGFGKFIWTALYKMGWALYWVVYSTKLILQVTWFKLKGYTSEQISERTRLTCNALIDLLNERELWESGEI